jgi:hypothetical protein
MKWRGSLAERNVDGYDRPRRTISRFAIPYKIEPPGRGMLLAHRYGAQRNIMRERPLIAADRSYKGSGGQAPYGQLTGGT